MDLSIPVMGGVDAISRIVAEFPGAKIVALTGRSEGTAKVHVLHIFAKLEVDDRTRAVTVALKRGIIHLE